MMNQANHGAVAAGSRTSGTCSSWSCSSASRSRSRSSPSTPGCPTRTSRRPTAVSVILAGVLLKMGAYGILRICYPILPDAAKWFALPLAILGAINIVYGAFCALGADRLEEARGLLLGQPHGLRAAWAWPCSTRPGITGAVLQMFNHGTITAMLFLMVGVIYDRAHHRDIAGFGGLGLQMPRYTSGLHAGPLRGARAARPERVRGRGAGLRRRLRSVPGRHHHLGPRHRPRRGLRAVDAAARLPRAAEREVRRTCRTSARASWRACSRWRCS